MGVVAFRGFSVVFLIVGFRVVRRLVVGRLVVIRRLDRTLVEGRLDSRFVELNLDVGDLQTGFEPYLNPGGTHVNDAGQDLRKRTT